MDIRILVVEDSAFMRKIIIDLLKDIDGVKVVGVARDGIYALEAIKEYKPDLVTLDIEMPRMDGLEALKKIKSNFDIPVIMLSSVSRKDATMEALQVGAEDFIEKPKNLNDNLEDFKGELEAKIKNVAENFYNPKNKKKKDYVLGDGKLNNDIGAIVIAASTGGPKALNYLVSRLPKETDKPIFIVQHMPKNFTHSFSTRMNEDSEINVVEAKDGMKVLGGTVYIAPGDYHMFIENEKIILNNKLPKTLGVRPAANYLFSSASKEYREKLVGVILTGMGRDGTEGMKDIKKMSGYNIAQDEETSVIFGMSESAISSGVVDEILSLKAISKKINRILR